MSENPAVEVEPIILGHELRRLAKNVPMMTVEGLSSKSPVKVQALGAYLGVQAVCKDFIGLTMTELSKLEKGVDYAVLSKGLGGYRLSTAVSEGKRIELEMDESVFDAERFGWASKLHDGLVQTISSVAMRVQYCKKIGIGAEGLLRELGPTLARGIDILEDTVELVRSGDRVERQSGEDLKRLIDEQLWGYWRASVKGDNKPGWRVDVELGKSVGETEYARRKLLGLLSCVIANSSESFTEKRGKLEAAGGVGDWEEDFRVEIVNKGQGGEQSVEIIMQDNGTGWPEEIIEKGFGGSCWVKKKNGVGLELHAQHAQDAHGELVPENIIGGEGEVLGARLILRLPVVE